MCNGNPNFRNPRTRERSEREQSAEQRGSGTHPGSLPFGQVPGENLLHELGLRFAGHLEHARGEVALQRAEDHGVELALEVVVPLRLVLLVGVQPQPPVPVHRPRRRRSHYPVPVSVPRRSRMRRLLPSLDGAVGGHGSASGGRRGYHLSKSIGGGIGRARLG